MPEEQEPPSRTYGYVRALQLEGRYPKDLGIHPISAMRINVGWGDPGDKAWPNKEGPHIWPPAEPPGLDAIAKKNRMSHYYRVRTSLEAKYCLSRQRSGCLASFPVTQQWFDADGGKIAIPRDTSEFIGDHAVTILGYADGYFKFVNCWGNDWGDHGFGYLPYDYFDRYLIDAFMLEPRRPVPLPKNEAEDLVGWIIAGPMGMPLHGVELWYRREDDIVGWAFAVERNGLLDVEELFVRPSYRKTGAGRIIMKQLRKQAEDRKLRLRFWVPHGDCVDEMSRARLSRLIELPLFPSGVTWTDFVGYDPNDARAHYSLALLLGCQSNIQETEKQYREAIRCDPNYADAHDGLGVMLTEQGEAPEAEKEFLEAIRCNSNSLPAHDHLGVLLDQQGRTLEAEKEFREAIRCDSSFAQPHHHLGTVLEKQGKPDEAEKEYRETIRCDPDYGDAHYDLGRLFDKQGRAQDAEKEYRETIRCDPNLAQAHYNLGVILDDQGMSQSAEAEYREAIRCNSNDASAHHNLGLILNDQGKTQDCIIELREAIRCDPNSAEAHYNLAAIFHNQGEIEDAKKEYLEAIRCNPNFAPAQLKLELLVRQQRKFQKGS